MMHKQLSLALAVMAMPLACSDSGPVDIGDPRGANLSDYAGSWDGYAEAYGFRYGGSDRVRVVMDAAGEGTIEFGDAPLFPPPTDPDVGYPMLWTDPLFYQAEARTRDGFRYPLYEASLEGSRLRLAMNPNDLFQTWCAMQTPVQTASGEYGCFEYPLSPFTSAPILMINLPTDGSSTCVLVAVDSGDSRSVDCGKWKLAYNCACSASGCRAYGIEESTAARLDAVLEGAGTKLVGTLQLEDGSRAIVRLQRQ